MWGIGRFASLGEFFKAAKEAGFDRFELNHAVDSSMFDGLRLNGYPIPSIHEPCPADISTGELKRRNWLISAADEQQRQHGVAAIRRSIDLAHELGSQVVIVHPGKVDVDTAAEAKLVDLYRRGLSNTREYGEAKRALEAARAARAEVNLRSVRRSLAELGEYASARDIRLGLENRYHYHEVPLPDELETLLEAARDGPVGFWYDVGHAQALDRLGFFPHEEWLERFAGRMVGVHLHDVVGLDDHRAAGSGQVDWDMVVRHVPAGALRTCEFQNDNSPQQIASGLKWLVARGLVVS